MERTVLVITSDPYAHLMRPFAYLFNIFWSDKQKVHVCGTSKKLKLPANFHVRKPRKVYDKEHYSTGMFEFIEATGTDHFVLMLEDYFLCHPVDTDGIEELFQFCERHPNVLRMDLTRDRSARLEFNDGTVKRDGSYGRYDLVDSAEGTPYQFSFQAGIWKKKLLLDILQPDRNPWELEIGTSPPGTMRVMGTEQNPVQYANYMYQGKPWPGKLDAIPEPHRGVVIQMLKEANAYE